MNIWDLDYISSSDEEDCDDTESSDSDDSEGKVYHNKRKVRKPNLKDVVDLLIERDKELSKKDMDARVRKLKMRH